MPLGPFKVEYVRYTGDPPEQPGYKTKSRLLNAPKRFDIAVAGTSYRQRDISRAVRDLAASGVRRIFEAELVYEDKNTHDKNAVACYIRGVHVGYIPRELCKEFRTAMAPVIPEGMRDIPLFCPGVFVGRGPDQYIGIRLDLPKNRTSAVAKSRARKEPVRYDPKMFEKT